METAVISYRVADFLKNHPPFNAMEESDLLELARQGRVRFHEANEYIVWQGEPYRMQVSVIQQGTVSLWDESGEAAVLRDVRGAGDMLGIEQFNDDGLYPYSARSASDVMLYVFPAIEFEALVLKYPYAQRYAAAFSNVASDYQSTEERREPPNRFLQDIAGRRKLLNCGAEDSIRDVVRMMRAAGADSIAVLDSSQRILSVLSSDTFLEWIEAGGGDPQAPVSSLPTRSPLTMAPNASISDGVLAMGETGAAALAITSDGTADGRLQALMSSRDLEPVFGDQPGAILREIQVAADVQSLRDLNQRARTFVLQHLTGAAMVDWLDRFTTLIDVRIVRRLMTLIDVASVPGTWCFCGAAGRGESLTKVSPRLLLILDNDTAVPHSLEAYRRVNDALAECGYLPPAEDPFPAEFYAANLNEWKQRFGDWVRDPVASQMYRARPLLDLRPIYGSNEPWREIENTIASAVDRSFIEILANDCMASLPPLTFFHDAVVDEFGEETAVFRLEHSALLPLVDVGRVFGMAAKKVLGSSTLERFAMARSLLPEHEKIFREAAETFRVVLWQEGRIGISQNTSGAELPAALLSRQDRLILKRGFRSILRLLEFTADPKWLKTL